MLAGPESILLHVVMQTHLDASPSHFLLQASVCRMMVQRLNFSVSLNVSHSFSRDERIQHD